VHPDHALRPLGCLRDVRDRERRGVRREDGVRAHEPIEIREERALDVELLNNGFDDEVAVGKIFDPGGRREALECRRPLVLREPPLFDAAAQVVVDSSSSLTSRPTVSMPAWTQTCAIPAPIVPSPTTPTFRTFMVKSGSVLIE
jgi:hypothetical protein